MKTLMGTLVGFFSLGLGLAGLPPPAHATCKKGDTRKWIFISNISLFLSLIWISFSTAQEPTNCKSWVEQPFNLKFLVVYEHVNRILGEKDVPNRDAHSDALIIEMDAFCRKNSNAQLNNSVFDAAFTRSSATVKKLEKAREEAARRSRAIQARDRIALASLREFMQLSSGLELGLTLGEYRQQLIRAKFNYEQNEPKMHEANASILGEILEMFMDAHEVWKKSLENEYASIFVRMVRPYIQKYKPDFGRDPEKLGINEGGMLQYTGPRQAWVDPLLKKIWRDAQNRMKELAQVLGS